MIGNIIAIFLSFPYADYVYIIDKYWQSQKHKILLVVFSVIGRCFDSVGSMTVDFLTAKHKALYYHIVYVRL